MTPTRDDVTTVPDDPADDPLFLAIDHVGIAVADLDAAIAFYRDTFGMHVVHREVNADQGVREAMLAVGDPAAPHACVQLLAPLTEESTIARFLDRSGPGMQQLAYRVRDVEDAARILRSRGVRTLYDAPVRGTAGSRINFLHPRDTGGVLVELVEAPNYIGDTVDAPWDRAGQGGH